MPRLDGTGPMGQGSQTGKKQGNCANTQSNETLSTAGNKRRKLRLRFQNEMQDEFSNGKQRGFGRGNRPHAGRGMGRMNRGN